MAKQTSSKPSTSPAKKKRTSEAPAPITKTILKAESAKAEPQVADSAPTQPVPVAVMHDVIIKAEPTHDQIAFRAFELYQTRGYEGGTQLGDWLSAERELRS